MAVINVMKNGDQRESMQGVVVKVSPEVLKILLRQEEKDEDERNNNNSIVSA